MEDNTKLQPDELNITFAELNQTVNWAPQQMNQTLTEPHIAQYNILLIEDQIVNQTKHP